MALLDFSFLEWRPFSMELQLFTTASSTRGLHLVHTTELTKL